MYYYGITYCFITYAGKVVTTEKHKFKVLSKTKQSQRNTSLPAKQKHSNRKKYMIDENEDNDFDGVILAMRKEIKQKKKKDVEKCKMPRKKSEKIEGEMKNNSKNKKDSENVSQTNVKSSNEDDNLNRHCQSTSDRQSMDIINIAPIANLTDNMLSIEKLSTNLKRELGDPLSDTGSCSDFSPFSSPRTLHERKRDLLDDVRKQDELLRKLRLVKVYRKKV